MKHTLITALFLIGFYCFGYAQTSMGTKFIGGSFSIGFSSPQSEANNNRFNFSLQPQGGYFIQDNLAVGSGIGFSITHEANDAAEYKNNNSTFFISPFGRYYFPLIADKFFVFGQGQLNFNFNKQTEKDNGTEISNNKNSTISLAVSPGFSFFPTENWAVELGFRGFDFTFFNPKGDNNNRTSIDFGISSFSPSLGVNYFF